MKIIALSLALITILAALPANADSSFVDEQDGVPFQQSYGEADNQLNPDAYAPATGTGGELTDSYPIVAGDRYAKPCYPTPVMVRQPYPGRNAIAPSSKLARPAGKSLFTQGQIVYVQGRVFDVACVPLRDAIVEIWHTNPNGDYRYASIGDLSNPYPTFAGAGRTVTDNRGEFLFETIYPGAKVGQTPFINVRVSHPSLGSPMITTLYFAGEPRNEEDKSYSRLNETTKRLITAPVIPFDAEDVNNGLLIHHDIVMRTRDAFRGF